MPQAAANIAEREGLALSEHRGKQITREMLQQADVAIVVEAGQKQWLAGNFPESMGRIFLLSHWTGGEDIEDPYRLDDQVFERVYAHINAGVAAWLKRLRPEGGAQAVSRS